MDILQNILIQAVIVVLMLPVMLVLAWPFMIVAWLTYRHGAKWLNDKQRLLVSCGIAALGIAPAFDAYRFPWPIYLTLWDGHAVGFVAVVTSFALTWLLCWLPVTTLTGRRHAAATARTLKHAS